MRLPQSNIKMRHWITIISLLLAVQLQASSINILTTASATKNANIGVLVKRLSTGEVVDGYRSTNLIPPASTMKLFTTATALEQLGSDYRIPTYLKYTGTIEQGVLHGDLYIVGQGDPTLGGHHWGSTNFLYQWSKAIRQAGITRIDGSVIGDVSYYDGDAISPGWLYEDMGNYYAPGIFALAYMDNTTNILLRSGAIGSVATVIKTTPEIPGLQFENHIRCTEINYDGAYVHGLPYQNCRYLTGSIPSNHGSFGVKGDIPNPALLLAQHLTNHLRHEGIEVRDSAKYIAEDDRKVKTLLYTHYSDSLGAIVVATNQHSINLNAEMLFRNLGAQRGLPCTIHNASEVVKQFWHNRGVDIFTARILDGCGLAPQNGLSADNFVNLLTYMARSREHTSFMQSLPVSGQSGTLKGFLAKTELDGKVHAKSGTIKGTKNYAGYIELPDGDKLVFAILVNSGSGTNKQIQHAIEQYLLDVYRHCK